MICEIRFMPMDVRIKVSAGTTVLEAARAAGIPITSLCTGNGACGKCRIVPVPGSGLTPISFNEKLSLGDLWEKGYRLACLTHVTADSEIRVPTESLREWSPLAKGAANALDLRFYPPRQENFTREHPLGIAIDLGTTTIAGYLYDLQRQTLLRHTAVPNPQVAYGDDIMTRLNYAIPAKGAQKLQNALYNGLNDLAVSLVHGSSYKLEDIVRLVIVGNSFMHHSFLGLNLQSLTYPPFAPEFVDGCTLRMDELRGEVPLLFPPSAIVEMAPLAGGFIGSDLLAGLLAATSTCPTEPYLFIDLGTNCEVALGCQGRILVSSASAGPAFEGSVLACGMPAQPGAINEVRFSGETVKVRTIHNVRPLGLCGSGAISLLAELLKKGMVDERGHLLAPNASINNGPAYALPLPGPKKIGLTKKDIGELQKAKAAVFAATAVLADEACLSMEDIKQFYVAGVFGSHLDVDHATTIGLLPECCAEKVRFLGNAAGDGARLLLLSDKPWRKMTDILHQVEVLNMGDHSLFMKEFLKAMFLPHEDSPLFTYRKVDQK